MQKKVEKVFIGTNIADSSPLVIGGSSDSIAVGELAILDKNKNLITSGDTIDDTDTIYIVEGLSDTYSYVTPNGTNIINVRKLLTSDKIEGIAVNSWTGKSYAAATEKVVTLSGTMTPVPGEEYVLRIVFSDIEEHPGQATYTCRVIAKDATIPTLYGQIATAINKRKERRLSATYAANVLTITALPYDDNAEVDSYNEYKQVIFKVFLFSDNFGAVVTTETVNPTPGVGTWKIVRDEEKWAQGYNGSLERTIYPNIVPAFRTVKGGTYDALVINHKNWYTSATGREEQVDITTKIYVPVGAGQATTLLADLNSWLSSCPKKFPTVSV